MLSSSTRWLYSESIQSMLFVKVKIDGCKVIFTPRHLFIFRRKLEEFVSLSLLPTTLLIILMPLKAHFRRRIHCYTRGQSASPRTPLGTLSPSRGILKKNILCRHKTVNPPEVLKPCMPCRGKTYKTPLAFFSIYTPAGFNLVENSGGKTQSIPFDGLFFLAAEGFWNNFHSGVF